MNEFVQAHATYRFIILDEEEEKPRMLVSKLVQNTGLIPDSEARQLRYGCSNLTFVWLTRHPDHMLYPKARPSELRKFYIRQLGPLSRPRISYRTHQLTIEMISIDPLYLNSIVNKYPGFPQAEYLYYPMNICRRLASLLVESNRSYPESMRTMTGLDVGWLRKV